MPLGVALAAIGIVITPGFAMGAWSPPVELGDSTDSGSAVGVEVTPQGAAVAGWTATSLGGITPSVVRASYRPVGGAFATGVYVDPLAPAFPAPTAPPTPGRVDARHLLPHITAAGPVVVWQRPAAGTVHVATSGDGVTYTPPTEIATGITGQMRSAQNIPGDIVLVTSDGQILHKRASASTWSAASFGGGNVREASVAVDPAGRAVIGWIDNQGRVKARRFDTATAAFVTPTRLIAPGNAVLVNETTITYGFARTVGVGTDAAGRGVIAWEGRAAGRTVVRAAFLTPRASLRTPGVRLISIPGRWGRGFDVAMALNGTATIAWRDQPSLNGPSTVFASRRAALGSFWSQPGRIALGNPGKTFLPVSVTMAKTVTWVAWMSLAPGTGPITGSGHAVQVARRVSTGPWTRTQLALDAGNAASSAAPEISARGSWAVVAWRTGITQSTGANRVSIFDPIN